MNTPQTDTAEKTDAKLAYFAILMFGLISFSGDLIYESARGVIPSYLEFLGATAFIIGLSLGLGEFLGYFFRLISGYLADTTRAYWVFVIVGYGVLIVIPLLSLTRIWQLAILFVIIERLGKGLRTPSRDTLLSVSTKGQGAGKAFGFHELLDQLGAIGGPALMVVILYLTNDDYSLTFGFLFLPYLLLVLFLFLAYYRLKTQVHEKMTEAISLEESQRHSNTVKSVLTKEFWLYTFSVFFNTAGLIHVALILYLAKNLEQLAWIVAFLYVIIQAVDAFFAPIAGMLYDKYGKSVLVVPFILSIIPTWLALQQTTISLLGAGIFFGIVLGAQESIYRASIADLVPTTQRGKAYGIFNTAYGVGFLISGAVFGFFIDLAYINIALIYAVILQVVALSLLTLSYYSTKARKSIS